MSIRHFLRISILLTGFTSLIGCNTTSIQPEKPLPGITSPKELHQWHATGRMAIKTSKEGGSVSFDWQQKGNRFELHFFGPLGMNNTQLSGNAHHVILKTAEGEVHKAASAELLMKRYFGWSLPINALNHWVLGIPAPNQPFSQRVGDKGQLVQLKQYDWELRYQDYQTAMGLTLPKKMQLHREDIDVKIIVQSWKSE